VTAEVAGRVCVHPAEGGELARVAEDGTQACPACALARWGIDWATTVCAVVLLDGVEVPPVDRRWGCFTCGRPVNGLLQGCCRRPECLAEELGVQLAVDLAGDW
jgi:hypothetical protein